MKILKNIFTLIVMGSLFSFSQVSIENPEKPENPNADRILKMEEMLRITDEGGDFFFKRPSLLQVGEDGSLFMYDADQFLKFTSDGIFIKNLLKKGQGPGEIQMLSRYVIHKGNIYIYDPGNSKILCMDQEGNVIEEFRFTERYSLLLGMFDDHFVFTKMNFPEVEERTGNFIDIPTVIVILSKDEKVIHEYPSVVEKAYQGENFMMSWGRSNTIMSHDGQSCFTSNPDEYMITELDLNKGEDVRKFSRKYPRVKPPKREPVPGRPALKIPERKFVDDITYLYSFKDGILVWTSVQDDKKGMLFDFFDKEGIYIDCFWVNVNGTVIATSGDFFFVREQDEEGNISIIKYRVIL